MTRLDKFPPRTCVHEVLINISQVLVEYCGHIYTIYLIHFPTITPTRLAPY